MGGIALPVLEPSDLDVSDVSANKSVTIPIRCNIDLSPYKTAVLVFRMHRNDSLSGSTGSFTVKLFNVAPSPGTIESAFREDTELGTATLAANPATNTRGAVAFSSSLTGLGEAGEVRLTATQNTTRTALGGRFSIDLVLKEN